MPNTVPTPEAVSAFEHITVLERENAELRQQLAALSAQAPYGPLLTTSDEALFESEARYRALIELSPQVVWMTDAQGNPTYTNRYWHELSGFTARETSGSGWTSAIHPEDSGKMYQGWMEAVAQGVPYETEARIRRESDDQYRWHLIRGMPVRNASGEIVKWIGNAVDVHDRRLASAAIVEAEEQLRFTMEAAGIGSCILYPRLEKKEWSGPTFEMLNVPRDQKPSFELFMSRVHPEDRQRLLDELQRLLDLKAPSEYDFDYRVVWPDGTTRWLLAKGKCFVTPTSSPEETCLHGIVMDITDRKLAEQERAMLTTAIQNSPDFIGITDRRGNILFLNHAGQKLVGLHDDAEARSKTVYDFMGPHEHAILETQILPAVRAGSAWEGEFTLRHFITQEPILVDTRGFGIFDETGRLVNIATVSRDISEKKKLEEQLRDAQKMEAVGRLAGGIAHDFNNLLTIIQHAGELLEERTPDAGNQKTVQAIRNAAQRASDLTQQLLAFGRRQMVHPAVINLNDVVRRMNAMLQRLAGEDIIIRMHLADELWNVKMDPVQMDQILLSLIADARDAMPHGGVIALRTFNHELPGPAVASGLPAGPYACLSFSDSGSGMDHQTLSHIFEPFFTSRELGRGSGLGLATVYGIVQQSGGDISAHSTPGKGTDFTLYLPQTTEIPPAEHTVGQDRPAGGSGKILLVEDEPSLRGMLAECIREYGYSVYEAADAESAMEVAWDQTLDLLVTDIVMPGASGSHLAAALAESHPKMSVIFMSGYTEHASLTEALVRPNTIFLQKPFRFKHLLLKIREALGDGGNTPQTTQ
jgi:PAS domain S-box-containing protein